MNSKLKLQINQPDEADVDIDDNDEDSFELAYLYLPSHPGEEAYGAVAKTIRLQDLYPYSGGPDINLDFDENNCIIGIEIL